MISWVLGKKYENKIITYQKLESTEINQYVFFKENKSYLINQLIALTTNGKKQLSQSKVY